MDEIDDYVARLRAAGTKRIIIAGDSLGVNAALGYTGRREDLHGIILLTYGHVPGFVGFASNLTESIVKAENS